MKRLARGLALAAVVAIGARQGAAWEAATTHAGLTEQAALASSLHERLRVQFAQDKGLFQVLTVPPADAPDLFVVLDRLNPTHGYVPDRRGKLSALGWLVAGSVVADTPEELAANHFYDPTTRSGLSSDSLQGLLARIRHRVVTVVNGSDLERSGVAAPDWIHHPKNPFGLAGFRDQYIKAVSARTAGERSRHLAGALLAAGAMLHVLEDMGSPSHARNDLAAHLDRLGPNPADVGSRFERVAALAFGRLGVPAPDKVVADRPLRAFFTARDGSGLADRVARSWFSTGTLPRSLELGGNPRGALQRLARTVLRPAPVPPPDLDLDAAATEAGGELSDARGNCVARYRVENRRLSWSIDDACALEQVSAILPTVSGYAAGMLETLFRGTLALEADPAGGVLVRAGAVDLGAGTITIFWDDGRGVRKQLASQKVTGAPRGQVAARTGVPPAAARRVSALFVGDDGKKRELLAAGTSVFPFPGAGE
jgi:hypothetical protein